MNCCSMHSPFKKILDFISRKKLGIYTINSKAELDGNTKLPTTLKEANEFEAASRRYVIVILGFLSFAILNAQRINTTLALVAMTNTSRTQLTGSECVGTSGPNTTQSYAKQGTFNWDSKTQGYIISSSFIGFVLTQIPGGRLSETLGAKEMLCFSMFCASLCNLLSPIAAVSNIYFLIATQFVKGMAQGFIQPAISCLMAKWYPKEQRSFLSSITFSGFPAGALLGGIGSGALCDTNFLGGWPSAFYVFGFMGALLVLFLLLLIENSPEEHYRIKCLPLENIIKENKPARNSNITIPWIKMVLSTPTWALLAGMIGQYWMTFYFISIHPAYLAIILHLNITQNGISSSLPYILQIFVTWLGSCASDWFSKKGYASTGSTRKICNTLSCMGFSVSMLGVVFAGCNITLNSICFFIAMSSIGLGFPGSLTVPMDMTKDFAGTLMGLSCTIASTTGFITPVIVGYLTNEQQTLAQWSKVSYISIAVVMGSGIIFHVFGSAELQNWDSKTEEAKIEIEMKPEDNYRKKGSI